MAVNTLVNAGLSSFFSGSGKPTGAISGLLSGLTKPSQQQPAVPQAPQTPQGPVKLNMQMTAGPLSLSSYQGHVNPNNSGGDRVAKQQQMLRGAQPTPNGQQVNPQQQQNALMQFALLAANQGNWGLADYLLRQGQASYPIQRPSSQRPSPGGYAGGYPGGTIHPLAQQGINSAQAAQNYAMNDAVSGASQAIVSGPLSGVYSMPVAPGSAHAGGAGGPAQQAALGQWIAAQNNTPQANINVDPTRGGQMALTDYYIDPETGDVRMYNFAAPDMRPEVISQLLSPAGGGSQRTIGATGSGGGSGGGGSGGSGGGSGGSGGGGETNDRQAQGDELFHQMLEEWERKTEESNADVDARYDEGKGLLTDLRSQTAKDIQRLNAQAAQDVQREANKARGAAVQNLVSRGLGNTTAGAAVDRGITREANAELRRQGDVATRQKLDANMATTKALTDWIYSKDNVMPDYGTMLDLALKYGQSGANMPGLDLGPWNIPGLANLLNSLGAAPQYQQPGVYLPSVGGSSQRPQQSSNQQQRPQQQYTPIPLPSYGSGISGGLLNAGMLYGLGQATPYIYDGLADWFSGGGADWGDQLGSSIVSGVGSLTDYLTQGLGWLGGAMDAATQTANAYDLAQWLGQDVTSSDIFSHFLTGLGW